MTSTARLPPIYPAKWRTNATRNVQETPDAPWVQAMNEHLPGMGEALGLWLDPETIAWPADLVDGAHGEACCGEGEPCWELYYAGRGGMRFVDDHIVGADGFIPLILKPGGLNDGQQARDPYLTGSFTPSRQNYLALTPAGRLSVARLAPMLTGQILVTQRREDVVVAMSELQTARILDFLYAKDAARFEYGPVVSGSDVVLRVWAPTAKRVHVRMWEAAGVDSDGVDIVMERLACGAWEARGDREWLGKEYLYEVEVYVPRYVPRPGAEAQRAYGGSFTTFCVTDPMSTGLTTDSRRSVVVDLHNPLWMPENWLHAAAPPLPTPAAHAIYELHVRDFSIADDSVPELLRGTYAAFGVKDSAGYQALAELSDAGMNTLHLLPTYDHGSIPENRADQHEPAIPEASPDSPLPQAAIAAVKDCDGYNWGYDPFHYGVPEGSYASPGNQCGGARIREFRSMVGALHELGYRVVLDQVFNHTFHYGLDEKSVFERIVPGYYHRLGYHGETLVTPCSGEIATEHVMAEKLMCDLLIRWARDYRVDGFRFDLMEFHSVDTMTRIRATLDALSPARDGVDGRSIYLYGEGWAYGTTADGSRFTPAVQGALAGTGIGTFNDRIRDAVRGPQSEDRGSTQGFGNGLLTDPNERAWADVGLLRHYTDVIRIGLAGNLRDYEIVASDGRVRTGEQVRWGGQPTGYGVEPHESVNYVDAHDNETLFDLGMWRLPAGSPMDVRIRMNTLALATVTLGQSPMLWHAGTDLLRSKSLDTDSYNSGDWFNAIDWTGRTTRFGVGLPMASHNQSRWDAMRPLLADPCHVPTAHDIATAHAAALDLLRIRASSPLFTLGSADLIKEMVTFPNSGPHARPGLLVMRIYDWDRQHLDSRLDGVVVVFNASPEKIVESIGGLAGISLELSPVQAVGYDDVVRGTGWDTASGTVTIPGRTVAVLEQRRQ